jgi:hypothetical protein
LAGRTSRIDQVEKGQEQSCFLQLARRACARASAASLCRRSTTARRADSYKKAVRRFTDIIGKS